ncbi:MAG: hypothetical protein HFG74_11340 [Hungatella sp.]|nr:hypothetical protein [Hungatella sp.]
MAAVFLLFVFGMGGLYLRGLPSLCGDIMERRAGIEDTIRSLEDFYTTRIPARWNFIELYGAVQRVLGRRAIEDFTLIKTDYGKIVKLQKKQTTEEIEKFADNIKTVSEYTADKGISMLYVTSLLPVVDASDLPAGTEEYSHENAAVLLRELEERDVEIIDLRKSEVIEKIGKERLFYKTDHHWSMETCFLAYEHVISEANRRLGWDLDPGHIYTDLENYEVLTKENSFLGSYGVKVGRYYAGKDDFRVYIPRFKTLLEFESYDADHNMETKSAGTFEDVFLDMDIVEDEEYFNKYNTFLRSSSIETRIVNRMAENERKVLFISHSYGRPFTQYLSLCFRETRYLDPQEGRYTDNYMEYIDEYDPDLVLIMTEIEGTGIGIRVEEDTR